MVGNQLAEEIGKDLHSTVGANQNDDVGQQLSISTGKDLQLKISGAHVVQSGNSIHIKAGSKAILQGGMSLSVKGGAGVITLDPSGVAILGPLVRINEGGGGGSAQAANPTQPGSPSEADNDAPGAKLKAPTGPYTPIPQPIDFDRARAQLAVLQEADRLGAPFVDDCPECELLAQQQAALAGAAGEIAGASDETVETDTLDLICIDADGGPAANVPYEVSLADGSTRKGNLDADGKAQLTGLPPGSATVDYPSEVDEAELQSTRDEIANVLNDIVAAEEQEKAKIEAEYAKHGAVGQWWEEEKAKARGMGKSVMGLLSFAKEVNDLTPINQFINAHKVAWESWRNTDDQPYLQRFADNLTESQFKETADVLGFDLRSISREDLANAWAMANFIWDDNETQKLLVQFGGDYIAAQHKLEVLEFGAGAATDIAIDAVITALTAGMGLAIVAGTKLHYLDKFKKLGPLFKKLAELRKKLFKRKKKAGQTGGEIPEQLGKPDVVDVNADRKDALDKSIQRKRVNPASFQEVSKLLTDSRKKLKSTGKYEPKYTQTELEHMVEQGTLQERYVVTLQKKKSPDGTVGYKRESGRTTTWTTTIDQMERADTDPELLCDLNGMKYDPDAEWEIIVIDQGKYYQQDGGLTFIPNYENTARLGKKEFSQKFTPEQIDRVMSPEYTKQYAEIIGDYKQSGDSPYDKRKIREYAERAFMGNPEGKSDFLTRHEFTLEVGTNEHFSGDGLTKSTGESGFLPKGQHGTLETITFEKKPATIAELEESGAILRIPAKPIR